MLRRAFAAATRMPQMLRACWRAWRSLAPADWSDLADVWHAMVGPCPSDWRAAWLSARLLRLARRTTEALAAAERAHRARPGHPAIQLELGRIQRQAGLRSDAIRSLAAAAQAGATGACRELLRYGARAHLPTPQPGVFAPTDYHALAVAGAPAPPVVVAAPPRFRIAVAGSAEERARTLDSLRGQAYPFWSLAEAEDPAGDRAGAAATRVLRIDLPAGAWLDPEALGWLAWATACSDASVVYADHDHLGPDGRRAAPVLHPAPDFLWSTCPPRLTARHEGLAGKVVHVPLVLMTLPGLPGTSPREGPTIGPQRSVSVIIPTRDNGELLRAAVQSLLDQAAQPERVEIIIVDNDTVDQGSLAVLGDLARRPHTRILPMREAFNWSRANNLGAAQAACDILLFLNDDTLMLTPDWDRVVSGLLASDAAGLVGARLLYPDRTIQHAGFVFGMDNGPQHEGRWMPEANEGPAGRWTATRPAVAVTGACMAIARADFAALGGFDEATFAVDFADLDFCLRVRDSGKSVIYCGDLTLIHHESVSRGFNLSRAQRSRAARERASFERRWGSRASEDPGYHPAWSREGCSFDGLTALSTDKVMQHLESQQVGSSLDQDAGSPSGRDRAK